MDVVFGLVLWKLFTELPRPSGSDWNSVQLFLSESYHVFVLTALAVAIVIIYWLQNNALFGYLRHTDNRHTAIAICQVFFLLLFLKAVAWGSDFPGTASQVSESLTAALVGFTAVAGWGYARKNRRLLSPEINDHDAAQIHDRTLAEPLTALITLPCAFVAPIVWELAWLSYFPLSHWLRVRRRRKGGH